MMIVIRSFYTIDGSLTIEGCHQEEQRWNGFHCPSFKLNDILQWLESQKKLDEQLKTPRPISWTFDEDSRTLTVTPTECDWSDDYKLHRVDGLEGDDWVSVGAFSWCWSEVE